MGNKMLIDAAHPEETRVVVLRGNRVEEFDYESAIRKQLRGNIYLAKVTRVEPSLQAAFVDYGGNRHGFLAFSEIHPDYYQIPVADRQALLEEEAEEESKAEAEAAAEDEVSVSEKPQDQDDDREEDFSETVDTLASTDNKNERSSEDAIALAYRESRAVFASDPLDTDLDADNEDSAREKDESGQLDETDGEDADNNERVESVGSEDALEEVPERVGKRRRIYKIQEVIKRRQIILVQVVKEERGNKGAALTTYLSMAGRYTVLMPNTGRGGGISRKITNPTDRKRLRKIASELEVPEGMGLIIRTAGASRTKSEIKRDYEYLLRLWENVRDLTLESTAPSLVYEEGDLIKRTIRDLYSKEIDEVLVAGDAAYRDAKDFMRMLMPSHAKNVQPYREAEPLFIRHKIERQLNAMFNPFVTLKSGGYIVINQTEALVAIDVNSGRATREHSIEETALKTNAEAAEEIARQLRLRDLAGLIVIDFIDMDERRNNRAVERKLKECLRNDRARIQVGRISHFGLLEMSRQRLRTGVLEGSTTQCAFCQGTGIIRSTESVALSVLRALEDTLITGSTTSLVATASVDVALYILNQKRPYLKDIESRYGATLTIAASEQLHGANFSVEHSEQSSSGDSDSNVVVQMDWAFQAPEEGAEEQKAESNNKRLRRRKRPRRKQEDDESKVSAHEDELGKDESEAVVNADPTSGSEDKENKGQYLKKPRRRGRRGGRRHRSSAAQADENSAIEAHGSSNAKDLEAPGEEAGRTQGEKRSAKASSTSDRKRKPRRRVASADREESKKPSSSRTNGRGRSPRRRAPAKAKEQSATEEPISIGATKPTGNSELGSSEPLSDEKPVSDNVKSVSEDVQEPRRRGWWQRRLQQSR